MDLWVNECVAKGPKRSPHPEDSALTAASFPDSPNEALFKLHLPAGDSRSPSIYLHFCDLYHEFYLTRTNSSSPIRIGVRCKNYHEFYDRGVAWRMRARISTMIVEGEDSKDEVPRAKADKLSSAEYEIEKEVEESASKEGEVWVSVRYTVEEVTARRKTTYEQFGKAYEFADAILECKDRNVWVNREFVSLHSPIWRKAFEEDEKTTKEHKIKVDAKADDIIQLLHIIYPSRKQLDWNHENDVIELARNYQVYAALKQYIEWYNFDGRRTEEVQSDHAYDVEKVCKLFNF